MLVVGRRGVDFVGHRTEPVGFVGKSGLGMFRAFALRPVSAIASAPASAAAAAAAACFAILALAARLAMRLIVGLAIGLALILTIGKLPVGLVLALRRAF